MSNNVMTQLSEAYRKLRNTFRFALGNLADSILPVTVLQQTRSWKKWTGGC